MTAPDGDTVHYIGILEAVVAVLAIKAGLDPEVLMGKAIENITEQSGMETSETERIIRERWSGRDLPAGNVVAQMFPEPLTPVVPVEEPPPPVDMKARLAEYREQNPKPVHPTTATDPTPPAGEDVHLD